ncbi:uncharacterized protein [Henckelia pumila]|uniref:uncharacterized protein n=1 Tax=Henckelia pumila TaxID=405737 RepID=UPI003C6E793B
MLEIGECDFGSGANQIGNLQRAGATRWSSHYDLVKSFIGMYSANCKFFEVFSENSPNRRAKAEVRGIYRNIARFEYVFIFHLMHKIIRTTDTLCQIIPRKSQDILAYVYVINYHPGKAKGMADALSRKSVGLEHLTVQKPLLMEMQRFDLEFVT